MEGQTFIELCEKTANVGYVLTQIQRKFRPEYAVITADGLEVKDSSGTQGLYVIILRWCIYILSSELP